MSRRYTVNGKSASNQHFILEQTQLFEQSLCQLIFFTTTCPDEYRG